MNRQADRGYQNRKRESDDEQKKNGGMKFYVIIVFRLSTRDISKERQVLLSRFPDSCGVLECEDRPGAHPHVIFILLGVYFLLILQCSLISCKSSADPSPAISQHFAAFVLVER